MCDHEECTVTVIYADGHENLYKVPVELYCGDMIDYVSRHVKNGSSIRNIGEVKQSNSGNTTGALQYMRSRSRHQYRRHVSLDDDVVLPALGILVPV